VNLLYPKLKIKFGDIMDLPYPDQYFDVYLSFGVIEHFTNQEDLDKIFSEIKRVTQKRVLITVPYLSPVLYKKFMKGQLPKDISESDFYQYYFSKEEMLGLLHSYGLKPYRFEFYATYIGLKRHSEWFGFLWKFKAFKYVLFKNRRRLDQVFGNRQGHMLACWADV
jgi:ubiquinone/menaquinone biosynthesis C-methylase UbiE